MISTSELRQRQLDAMEKLEGLASRSSSAGTIVPMMEDYENDERLCLTCVAFIPSSVRDQLQALIIEPLSREFPEHHFYAPESLHLTIQNVRTIQSPPNFTEQDIQQVARAFAKVFQSVPAISFELNGFLKLPTSLSVRAFGDENFVNTVARLRHALIDCGIPDDKKYIDTSIVFGNVTVCRYRSHPSPEFTERLNNLREFNLNLPVTEVSLISTNAACNPHHTRIWSTFDLGT